MRIGYRVFLVRLPCGIFWAVIEKSTNKFIGDFAFFKIDKNHSRAEIGYTLKPKFWGKGLMKEAMLSI